MTNSVHALKAYLDACVARYEHETFIASDPVSIPHAFDDPADQEVIGLFAALLAWGQRKTMLNKLQELCERMQYQPASFIRHFDPLRDAHHLEGFKHRTFQSQDAIALTCCLSEALNKFGSLELCFQQHLQPGDVHIEKAIQGFSTMLFQLVPNTPRRLQKHLAQPNRGSACKRLCMYLRWMIRKGPVDLGIWSTIPTAMLVPPLDVHSGRLARALGMLNRTQNDWKAAQELYANCQWIDPIDPCKYDFAFFGLGVTHTPLPEQFIGDQRVDVTEIRTYAQ